MLHDHTLRIDECSGRVSATKYAEACKQAACRTAAAYAYESVALWHFRLPRFSDSGTLLRCTWSSASGRLRRTASSTPSATTTRRATRAASSASSARAARTCHSRATVSGHTSVRTRPEVRQRMQRRKAHSWNSRTGLPCLPRTGMRQGWELFRPGVAESGVSMVHAGCDSQGGIG